MGVTQFMLLDYIEVTFLASSANLTFLQYCVTDVCWCNYLPSCDLRVRIKGLCMASYEPPTKSLEFFWSTSSWSLVVYTDALVANLLHC